MLQKASMGENLQGKSSTDKLDCILSLVVHIFSLLLILSPQLAHAASSSSSTFGGITDFLKSITNLLIFEWGYYIGIMTLAIQGYRWKTGRIDLMQLGGWGLGIGIVLFAPNIVTDLKNRAGSPL